MSLGILIDVGQSPVSVVPYDETAIEQDTVVSLDLDVTSDEVQEWSNDVTSFPVEIGSPITDHIQPLPDKVSITGIISNSAISETAMSKLSSGDDRCQTAFDLLRKISDDRKLVTLYTRYKIYSDMALKSTNIPRDASIGDSIKFRMEFIHVRLVNTQTIDVPAGISKKLDKKQGGKNGSVGHKTEPKKPAGPVTPVVPQSFADALAGGGATKAKDWAYNFIGIKP